MKQYKQEIWQTCKDYTTLLIGLTLYAIGFTVFMLPYQITTGGLSGAAAIVFYATGFPVQYTYLIINTLLLIIAVKVLGFRFCIKTIVGSLLLTFEYALFQELLETPDGTLPQILGNEAFMACMVGAACEGVGLGIVFLSGGSTGGTDIIAAIVNKYRDISLGHVLMLCDIAIVSSSYFIFHSPEKVVFGFCVLLTSTVMLDHFMNSARQSVQLLIISNKHQEIAAAVSTQIHRGITILHGEGWYSHKERPVIMVLARRTEGTEIFRLVHRIDPKAFVSQCYVEGVYGEGFDKIKVK